MWGQAQGDYWMTQDNLSYLLYSSFPPKIFEGEGTWRSGEDQNDGYTMLSVAPPRKKKLFNEPASETGPLNKVR